MLRRNPLERLAETEGLGPLKRASAKRYAFLMMDFARYLGKFAPTHYRSQLRKLIHKAGLAGRISPEEVLGLKLLGMLVFVLAALYFCWVLRLKFFQSTMLLALSGLLGFTAPDFLLSRQIAKRRQLVAKHLPDFIDLLATCVEAGLGLDAAIDRISRRFPGPLGEEFQRYLWEVQIGRPRNLALMSIAERTNCEDIRILSASLTQAELFGIPVANVLKAQAEALRERRLQRTRERARRAPLLMLPALVFCFLPVIFLLIFAPLLIRARQSGLLQFLGF